VYDRFRAADKTAGCELVKGAVGSRSQTDSVMKILANCEGIHPGTTLGVTHFTWNVFAALRAEFDMQIACQVLPDMVSDYCAQSVCDDVVPSHAAAPSWLAGSFLPIRVLRSVYRRASGALYTSQYSQSLKGGTVEYVPHHFQRPIGKLPTVVTCFDLHIFDVPWKYRPRQPLLNRFLSVMRSASAIVTPFRRPFRKLPSLVADVEKKVFLATCPTLLADVPLDKAILQLMRARFDVQGNSILLLYPAMLQEHKNHKKLLAALAILRAGGKDIRLICPGPGFRPDVTRSIMRHAESLGLGDAVSWPGLMSSEEIRCLYELCTAVVSPSLAEGGNAIAQEAIAFGKPVACADTEASREHIALMGANVPLFAGNDADSIAEGIWEIIRNGSSLVASNEGARERIEAWTWHRVAERYAHIIRWVAAGCKPEDKPERDPGCST